MAYQTAEQVAQRAFDLGLLDERQLREVWGSFGSRNVALQDLIQTLVRREFMTNYQIERLMKGDRSGFFFGDYRVLYLVGTGTFSRVFRAVHRKTGKVVALKVLRNRFSENKAQAALFLREGRVGCALRHPNIVPIYEAISDGKCHFLVMEFVEGRNLREFVRIRKKLDPLEATHMMTGIADGLRYAFENGRLTHRDLKMSNILVSSRGEAKLVDFGLASMDDGSTDSAVDVNTRTVDYAALERATGVRKDDVRSDIYFLGCIYYNMLTGVPPLSETRDRLQRLSKQRFLEVVPIQKQDASLPACVTMVVNKAMTLDPEKRYQSPASMVADLRLAAKHIQSGKGDDIEGLDSESVRSPISTVEISGVERSVMIVESDGQMQEVFRKNLKLAGYRVLMTADPARAVSRFRQDAEVADGVVFNSQQIGEPALEMFNELGRDEMTSAVPALLLLGEHQKAWKTQAQIAQHRMVLTMPVTMRQFRTALERMLAAKTPQSANSALRGN